MAENLPQKFGAATPNIGVQLRHKLARRLTAPLMLPSWGPAMAGEPEAQTSEAWDAGDQRDDSFGDQAIARKIDNSRRVAPYLPLYIGAAIICAAVFLLALYVGYRAAGSQFWLDVLSSSFIPAALYGSRLFMGVQVALVVLAMYFVLKAAGLHRHGLSLPTAIALLALLLCSVGYLFTQNNNSVASSTGPVVLMPVGEEDVEGFDALFASLGEPREGASIAVSRSEPELPPSDALDSIDLSAGADGWLWLFFGFGVFVAVTAIAAPYFYAAEQNIRNAYIAGDCASRCRAYSQFHRLELAARNAADMGAVA